MQRRRPVEIVRLGPLPALVALVVLGGGTSPLSGAERAAGGMVPSAVRPKVSAESMAVDGALWRLRFKLDLAGGPSVAPSAVTAFDATAGEAVSVAPIAPPNETDGQWFEALTNRRDCQVTLDVGWPDAGGTATSRLAFDACAHFDWSMPEREPPRSGALEAWRAWANPATWTVVFDACPSSPQLAVREYRWQVDAATVGAADCRFEHALPSLGRHRVALTVVGEGGHQDTMASDIELRDMLIVSLGDSVASGEGNPDWWPVIGQPGTFTDQRCHRSMLAGSAKVAEWIEAADPRSSVTFLHLACSGAGIVKGLLEPYAGIEVGGWTVVPQIEAARTLTCPQTPCELHQRRIDALLLTVGANDVNFGGVAAACLMGTQDPGGPPCYSSAEVRASVAAIADLPALYARLDDAIRSQLRVDQVYITEYFNPLRGNSGQYCVEGAQPPLIIHTSIECKAGPPLIDLRADESQWAEEQVVGPLNVQVAAAAAAHDWHFVGHIAERFTDFGGVGHGYCASKSERWIRRFEESCAVQGTEKGTLHPNEPGHLVYGSRLFISLVGAFLAMDGGNVAWSGTHDEPLGEFDNAVEAIPAKGTVWIRPGTYYTERGRYDKPMILQAPNGDARLVGPRQGTGPMPTDTPSPMPSGTASVTPSGTPPAALTATNTGTPSVTGTGTPTLPPPSPTVAPTAASTTATVPPPWPTETPPPVRWWAFLPWLMNK